MLDTVGYCGSSSPLDGDGASNDGDGTAAAAAAGVQLSLTAADDDDDVGWTSVDATRLSTGSSTSCPEERTSTGEQADADCRPIPPCSSTVANESGVPGAGLGAATSDQRSSPPGYAHQRRGSLDWSALEAAAKKSSTSASAGGDATGTLLQITETLGVVRHNVKQARSEPMGVGYSPDRSVTLPPRSAPRRPLDFHSLKQQLEKLMTSSGTVVSDQKVAPKDSRGGQVKPAAVVDAFASGTQRAGDGAPAACLVAPTSPVCHSRLHPHPRPQQQQQLQQPSSLTASTSCGSSQRPVELRRLVLFVLRTSPLARLLTSCVMMQTLQCDFQLHTLLLRHQQERLQLAMRHTQELMAVQAVIESVSSVSPAAATQRCLDSVTLYTLAQLQSCLLPNLSSHVVTPQTYQNRIASTDEGLRDVITRLSA